MTFLFSACRTSRRRNFCGLTVSGLYGKALEDVYKSKNVKFPDKWELVTNEVFVCLRTVFRLFFCIYVSKMLFDQLMEIFKYKNIFFGIFMVVLSDC